MNHNTNFTNIKILENSILNNSFNTKLLIEFQKGIDELEKWGITYLLSILQQKNLFKQNGDIHSLSDIKYTLNALPKYERLLKELMELFINHNYVIQLAPEIYEGYNIDNISTNLDCILISLVNSYPSIEPNANFLRSVLNEYLNVLSGESSFLNIMFPSGSFKIIEQIYKINPDASYFNVQVAQFARSYAENYFLEHGKPLSILEIGAGIGSSTMHILPVLHESNLCSEYMYTDISKAFTQYVKKQLELKYSFMSFANLNIEETLTTQGFSEKKYDIIVATNVLHATKQMLVTLKNVRTLLKPTGILIINEGIKKRDYSTLVYGLTDGWWMFEDNEWRIAGSPFINLENWPKLLALSGFKQATPINLSLNDNMQLFQDIIIAS